MDQAEKFFDTDAGQLITGSKKYLSAAEILMRSPEFAERPSLLFAPLLHSACHGCELLLKYPLVRGGMTLEAVRKKFGHDLVSLWEEPANALVRVLVMERAGFHWEEAKANPKWQDKFEGCPHHTFEKALKTLARLHSAETNFALRYVTDPKTMAPRPWLPVLALLDAADQGVKDWCLMRMTSSRTSIGRVIDCQRRSGK